MLTTRDCVSPLGGTGMPERRTADPLEPYVERLIENMEANADDSATGNSALSSDFAAWGLSRCIVSFRHFFDHDHLHEQGVSLTGPLRLSEDQAEGALQTIMVFYLYLTCTSEQGDSVARKVLRIRPTGLCQISDHETQRDDVRLDRLSLARRHLRDQPVPARKEQPALVGQRDVRAASTAQPEVLSQLVNRRAESRC